MPPPKRPTELPELSFLGPFGGVQSECGLVQMEGDGFQDVVDVVFYDRGLMPKPGLSMKPSPTNSPIQSIFDFFDSTGNRHSGVIAGQNIYSWNPSSQTWTKITGTLNSITGPISWTVVAGKLLFSNGVDKVQSWDGQAATFSTVSTNAVPAFHLGELGNHLIATPTLEGGAYAPQRMRWTGAGDPTDWTSFDSGINDLFNDLGPINGWRKIYQQGYVFQQWGIVQQSLTGNANQPFYFVPLSSKQKGLYYPWSLSGSGEFAIYIGKDNVYLFNGSSSEPIGDMPLQGRTWIGARDRILADLYAAPQGFLTYGIYVPSTRNHEYETYWLIIPGSSTWVYNMKEGNWTKFTWDPAEASVAGGFFDAGTGIRIIDLIGTIQAQAWTPAQLAGGVNVGLRIIDLIGSIASQTWTPFSLRGTPTPSDSFAIGFADGSLGTFDFTNSPDRPWKITTGTLAFGDTRHSKDIRRVRLVLEAYTNVNITISASNEQGQTETKTFSVNASPGNTQYQVFPFHIPGVYMPFVFSGPSGQNFRISEIAIGFNIGKEVATQ